jgi:hypothetical protein
MVTMVVVVAAVAMVLRPRAGEASWQVQPAMRCEDGAYDEQQAEDDREDDQSSLPAA